MTPKQKAVVLYCQMLEAQNRWDCDMECAKMCALIAIRELRNQELTLSKIKGPATTYWDIVEEELKNMTDEKVVSVAYDKITQIKGKDHKPSKIEIQASINLLKSIK